MRHVHAHAGGEKKEEEKIKAVFDARGVSARVSPARLWDL